MTQMWVAQLTGNVLDAEQKLPHLETSMVDWSRSAEVEEPVKDCVPVPWTIEQDGKPYQLALFSTP